jgi:hypothetical protein
MKWIVLVLICIAMLAGGGIASMKPIKEATMTARGSFEVKMIPQSNDPAPGAFGRFLLEKKFQGDLEAVSKGQMLTSGGPPSRFGGYVALEEVRGTLNGKSGGFVLIHRGTMSDGNDPLDVTVVPGSGTEELAGIAGTMKIIREGAKHSYEFSYTFGL